MNKWVLKEVAIDEDEHCLLQTDGSFLYLLCKDGLYKVGSGYSGTVRVRHMIRLAIKRYCEFCVGIFVFICLFNTRTDSLKYKDLIKVGIAVFRHFWMMWGWEIMTSSVIADILQ